LHRVADSFPGGDSFEAALQIGNGCLYGRRLKYVTIAFLMARLGTLVDDHMRELTGVEFKVVVYLYRRLDRKAAGAILEIKIADIARGAGVCPKQTQTALKTLEKKGMLVVDSGRGRTTRCSLPPLPRRSAATQPAPPPPSRSSSAPPPTLRRRRTAPVSPVSAAKPRDTGLLKLLAKAYDSADAALLDQLELVAGGRARLSQCLQFMAERGIAYDTAGLLRAAVGHECNNSGSEFAYWIKKH
jgi:hypothetical protein